MQFFIDGNQIDVESFCEVLALDISAIKSVQQTPEIQLYWESGQVYYQDEKRQKIEISIHSQLEYHKRYFHKNSIYEQPLFKALGLKKGKAKPNVLDCTAGMLGDSLLIYSVLGKIDFCERNPLIALLIQLSLKQNPLEHFNFHPSACLEMDLTKFDTLFYDPMYEQKNIKSAPKKEMLFFREHIGEDFDRQETIQNLLNTNKRVVVKRSSKASAFLKPDISFGKKSTVYDVYLAKS